MKADLKQWVMRVLCVALIVGIGLLIYVLIEAVTGIWRQLAT